MSEQRKYMRFNVLMDALCKGASGALKKLKINNFCREGVGVVGDYDLFAGQDVEIEVIIPGDNVPVLFQGEVAWAAGADGAEKKGGVKIKKITNHDRSRLLEHIYKKWLNPAGK